MREGVGVYQKRYSDTLLKMLLVGIGYRNESYNNSGVTNLRDIITFETKELGNRDIFISMKHIYSKKYTDKPFKDRGLTLNTRINNVMKYLSELLECNEDELHGVWLTTVNKLDRYSIDKYFNHTDADSYYFTNSVIPISDLDGDGALFVYKRKHKHPEGLYVIESNENEWEEYKKLCIMSEKGYTNMNTLFKVTECLQCKNYNICKYAKDFKEAQNKVKETMKDFNIPMTIYFECEYNKQERKTTTELATEAMCEYLINNKKGDII